MKDKVKRADSLPRTGAKRGATKGAPDVIRPPVPAVQSRDGRGWPLGFSRTDVGDNQDDISLCRCCAEALHGFEIAIGVCTDCVSSPPGTAENLARQVTTGQPSYGIKKATTN